MREVGSFHVGGRQVTLSGLPEKEIVFTAGAAPFKVTVPVAVFPPLMSVGVMLRDNSVATPAAGQAAPAQTAPRADPYANNAAPGTLTFPLAAPAGKDSNSLGVAPPGAVNQGPFDPATWKYGPAFNAPAGEIGRAHV